MSKKKSGKNTKGLSKVKKKNIRLHKLAKQGVLNKEAKKTRRRESRKAKRREVYKQAEEKEKLEAMKQPEIEFTGKEMMEMIDDEDMKQLLKVQKKKEKEKLKNIKEIEEQGRMFNEEDEDSVKKTLPILTEEGWQDGQIVQNNNDKTLPQILSRKDRKNKSAKGDEDSGFDEEEIHSLDLNKEKIEEKTVAQILAERKRTLHEQKVKMACLALNIVQEPAKLANLGFLLNMLRNINPKEDVTVYKYTLHTVLQVFHDLIPSYRIQENALQNKLKKDNYQMARQELDFLVHYRQFLKALEAVLVLWKEEPSNFGLEVLSETVIYCLGDLLVLHPYFNYSMNIIQAIVPYLNHTNDKVRKLTFDALSHLIKSDKKCSLTLEIVRKIYRLTHRLRFKVKNDVFGVFLSIRGSEMKNMDAVQEEHRTNNNALARRDKLIRKLAEKFEMKPSRKQKKEKKKMAKIRNQMEGINKQEIQNIQNEHHSEIMQTVFGLYIHVLKKKPKSKLMSAVLEGLAKFAHLINMEFFTDLLALMSKFLEDGTLGLRESLHCIQTVFTILSGQGEALNIDPQRFYNQFYRIMMEITRDKREQNIETILEIVEQMLVLRRKKVSSAKVLSYAKRLSTLSLELSHQTAIPLLVKLKKVFTTFSATEALLDPDPEGSPGVFHPEISDPEHANTAATALWEMILCQRSYHPNVALLAKNILSGISAREVPAVFALTDRSTSKLLEAFDQSKLKFNPAIREPSLHLQSQKKSTKRIFQNGELDLNSMKLQALCEKVLGEKDDDDDDEKEPPKKKLKSSATNWNFYENINGGNTEKETPDTKDFTSA